MALIPTRQSGSSLQVDVVSSAEQPTRTYRIDHEKKRIIGFVDNLDAMEQAIYKVLMTDRFRYDIYSWNYGTEWDAVWGRSSGVFESEIKRIIKEALLADSRILDVVDFKMERISKRVFAVSFTAETVFGNTDIMKEVDVDERRTDG